MCAEHIHRPGPLKHKNKPFKSKHASKGSIKKQARGRVEKISERQYVKSLKSEGKLNRKNTLKQTQQKKREDHIRKIRKQSSIPRLCVNIFLNVNFFNETISLISNRH